MRTHRALSFAAVAMLCLVHRISAQAPGHWPPDSLINTQVFPKTTPVMDVVGQMRNIAFGLGVRCQYCHVGQEGQDLGQFDFASDQKRTKLVARQMLRMVQEINRRLDTIPRDAGRTALSVGCSTCHHGASRPVPLPQLITETAQAAGADSAVRAYRALRDRYYGRDTYDFGEPSLDIAAFRTARAGKFDDALALLRLNEEFFPTSGNLSVFRGNILLMRGDTSAAVDSYREALRREPQTAGEARIHLRELGRQP